MEDTLRAQRENLRWRSQAWGSWTISTARLFAECLFTGLGPLRSGSQTKVKGVSGEGSGQKPNEDEDGACQMLKLARIVDYGCGHGIGCLKKGLSGIWVNY